MLMWKWCGEEHHEIMSQEAVDIRYKQGSHHNHNPQHEELTNAEECVVQHDMKMDEV
jgi:hypothetical protein